MNDGIGDSTNSFAFIFADIFEFNNQFMKSIRIWSTSQKYHKKIFCLFQYQGLWIYKYNVFLVLKMQKIYFDFTMIMFDL